MHNVLIFFNAKERGVKIENYQKSMYICINHWKKTIPRHLLHSEEKHSDGPETARTVFSFMIFLH